MHEKIGEGGFGTVHLATNKETKKQYAVKYMDMTQICKSLFPYDPYLYYSRQEVNFYVTIFLCCLWMSNLLGAFASYCFYSAQR